jgi:DNA polymerase III alpha subunit
VGKQVSVAGMRQTWRRVASQTGPGDHLYLMSLEDLEGMLEVLIPSDVYRRGRSDLSTGQPFVVEGVMGIAADNAEPFLRASRIRSL